MPIDARLRLLVSVRDADEAAAALRGGADFIDAKEPAAGALGAVSLDTFRAIVARVGSRRPVTAALGDAAGERTVQSHAAAFADAGASLVKIGFAGVTSRASAEALVRAAVRGAGAPRVVAVAYADCGRPSCPTPDDVLAAAAAAGAAGVLLDTADKDGPGLSSLMSASALQAWVGAARARGLRVALAGKLAMSDLPLVRQAGATIAGVRGAACDGGREGRVNAARVRALHAECQRGESVTLPAI